MPFCLFCHEAAYVVLGNNNIHVIDLSDVTNMTLLHHTSIDGVDVTDVEYCGGYVFVSMDNKADKENGMVKVYRGYNESTHQMELIHTITGTNEPRHEKTCLLYIVLSKQRTTKALIRLCGRAG